MKSKRKTWLAIASDSDLLMIYNLYKNCEDILYMSVDSDKYDRLIADIEKEAKYRQMLKKGNKQYDSNN